ncbi:MAG: acyl-CoA dehydratase activase [bacterium]|nr:acyl-CoA dehydratase activase [bacterium]
MEAVNIPIGKAVEKVNAPEMNGKRSLGICLGASTLSVVERVNGSLKAIRLPHGGSVGEAVQRVVGEAVPVLVGITGRKFRDLITARTISEPEAVEFAYRHVRDRYPEADGILSAGSESIILYSLDKNGRIRSVHTGNKCASGTGEFFLQQLKRMDLDLAEAIELADFSQPYEIAHRCSVFSKSDCTHALNKGVGKGRVVAGLCRMVAVKMTELLRSAKVRRPLIVGGVSQNPVVVDYLRQEYPMAAVPEDAPWFEAMGALMWAQNDGHLIEKDNGLVKPTGNLFTSFPELKSGLSRVVFKTAAGGKFCEGAYVIGLDVGSTTTKAVLVRAEDRTVVASKYLRTLGDPVGASRRCYQALGDHVPEGVEPDIVGLGVTGSGRRLAALHGLTANVINEIMAHAVAAVHYDPEVDTIFEIGGQDAKYTSITNMVPTDYAMNEACSAGTGSFLEEACLESFGISTCEIADLAMGSDSPPNFNDQCAAFIGSDIKTAIQQGTTRDDSVAGLVYSVCRNYLTRVKGSRPVGQKIFMQGGVCYNRAVPLAMSILCEREIVVPPDPGLMGAFGAALVVLDRVEKGDAARDRFDLSELALREIGTGKPFVCGGGREKCDRKCKIQRYVVNGRTYPFGGACDRYYNLREKGGSGRQGKDLVRLREELVFDKFAPDNPADGERTVGILTSLYTATAYPLYAHFFTSLGLRVVNSDRIETSGVEEAGAPFCLPVLQSHGLLKNLLSKGADTIFVPHVMSTMPHGQKEVNSTCPLVQGEPYYLKAAFYEELAPRLVTGVLEFDKPARLRKAFITVGEGMGFSRRRSGEAFDRAWLAFQSLVDEFREQGQRALEDLEPGETAIVLLGRAYNAFTRLGNMGVPQKFAARGHAVIPCDFLPLAETGGDALDQMYWASGEGILRAANIIRDNPNLFGVYVTNFSCGPDSFIIEQFRNIMGQKPFLTLQFDSHTADAGVDTRIDAFLDVVKGYLSIGCPRNELADFTAAKIDLNGPEAKVITSDGRHLALTDPAVHMVVPSMGETVSAFFAAGMNYFGIRTTALPAPGPGELAMGRDVTSCKECLPYTLTTGSLLRYLKDRGSEDEVMVFFMPETSGPCRFGQFSVAMKQFIKREAIRNVALLSLTSENGYAGMPPDFTSRAVLGLIMADGLDDIYSAILALAEDTRGALKVYRNCIKRITRSLASASHAEVLSVLLEEMMKLSRFGRKTPMDEATKVTLTGEVYVRKDGLSCQSLVERFAAKGVITRTTPIYEWFLYTLYLIIGSCNPVPSTSRERVEAFLKDRYVKSLEKKIHGTLRYSGYFDGRGVDVGYLLSRARTLINPRLTGEAILTVSGALREVGDETHGVISIGPFGCMPSRIAESILTHRRYEEKYRFSERDGPFWYQNREEIPLPFLALETDGSPFPQLTEARLESFLMSAEELKLELSERRAGSSGQG